MKKTIVKFSACAIALLFASNVLATTLLEGEALLSGNQGGSSVPQKVYVDYMVSNADLAGGAALTFLNLDPGPGVKGTQALYDGSTYFYYYQLENNDPANTEQLIRMTLSLDPGVILTAGFISGADLDNPATFNHNIAGEHENPGAALNDPNTGTGQSVFRTTTNTAEWAFDPLMPVGDESSVLFLTSNYPWIFSSVGVQDGSIVYSGLLPVPSFSSTVPEPFSILLLSGSLIGLVLRKRK